MRRLGSENESSSILDVVGSQSLSLEVLVSYWVYLLGVRSILGFT